MKPRILFSSVCGPFEKILGRFLPTDQMAFRLTRGQELFCLYQHTHYNALHLMAQNLSCPSVVLENPSLDRFTRELAAGYDYVCISFKAINLDRLLEMCEVVRHRAPKTRIVVGGYGTICSPLFLQEAAWQGKIDHLCDGEGVAFMRTLLSERHDGDVSSKIPKMGINLPWLTPHSVGNVGVILSGLGCVHQCPFCNTSAFTKGRYIEVMTAEQIYRSMRYYWESTPFTNTVYLYDENFLNQKEKVDELGRRIRSDHGLGLNKLNYFTFSSISAIARYEPEELLLNGMDTIWIGVESKYSPLKKLEGGTARGVFSMLHSMGIKTVGSWIIGEDFQTPENIQEDIDDLLALDPTFQQLSVLFVTPGMKLWDRLRKAGRIPEGATWKDCHIYGNTFVPKHFTYEQMLAFLEQMYRRIYRERGPTVMKNLEVNLNGYEYCIRSRNPLLREAKARFFGDHCRMSYPLTAAALRHAPSERVRRRIETLDRRYRDLFGDKAVRSQQRISEAILRNADREMKRRAAGDPPPIEEPFRRYTYPPLESRPQGKPYLVEYPQD